MIVISPRFVVLASLCAVLSLVLPLPVEAAHLYGSNLVGKYDSPYFQTRARDSSMTAHRYDGKGDGHRAPNRRDSELPPLLRRYRPLGHNKVYDQQAQGPHDHTDRKVPRSAFARSRYRQDTSRLSRRSSVYVSGEHGDLYSVSRTPSGDVGHGNAPTGKQSSRAHNRRQIDQSNLVTGRIDIMSAAQSPNNTQHLASLAVGSVPIDWTSGQSSARAFPLNASTTNQTQFIMLPADESTNEAGNYNKHVTLATEVFDASNAEMVMYCATYDSDPGSSSALVMTPCTGTIQSAALEDDVGDPCADDGNDTSSSNSHESQIFSYDPSSGRIEPMSATASSSGAGNGSKLASCVGARMRRDNGNSTTSGSVRPSSTSTNTAPSASASQQAQNVTLVYVANALEVPAASPGSSNTTGTANMCIDRAAVLTTTITTTVVTTVTSSGSSTPSRTGTPSQAAMSVSTASAPLQASGPSTTTTATLARSSFSVSSSASATATTKAPANADESLEVDVVGVTSSTTAGSSSTSITAPTTTTTKAGTSTYGSSSTSQSLNALAVASSLANEMAPQDLTLATVPISK